MSKYSPLAMARPGGRRFRPITIETPGSTRLEKLSVEEIQRRFEQLFAG